MIAQTDDPPAASCNHLLTRALIALNNGHTPENHRRKRPHDTVSNMHPKGKNAAHGAGRGGKSMKNRAGLVHIVAVASMVGALVLSDATTASAQRRWGWGRPSVPRAGACFFRDANFQNDYFCVQADDEVA